MINVLVTAGVRLTSEPSRSVLTSPCISHVGATVICCHALTKQQAKCWEGEGETRDGEKYKYVRMCATSTSQIALEKSWFIDAILSWCSCPLSVQSSSEMWSCKRDRERPVHTLNPSKLTIKGSVCLKQSACRIIEQRLKPHTISVTFQNGQSNIHAGVLLLNNCFHFCVYKWVRHYNCLPKATKTVHPYPHI